MSLIADALKAAQESRSGGGAAVQRTAVAKRILAPPARGASIERGPAIPTQVRIALAVFGAAAAVSAAVVLSASRMGAADAPEVRPLAVNSLMDSPPSGSAGAAITDGDDAGAPEQQVESSAAVTSDAPPSSTTAASEASRPSAAAERPRVEQANDPNPGATTSRTDAPAAAPRREEDAPAFELRLSTPARTSRQWFDAALAAQRRRDYGAAIQLYERTLQEDPENAEALNNLGTVYQASGDPGRAREAFRRAISVQPAYAAAWSNLGVALGGMNEISQAQAALAEAIRLDPGNHGAKVNLALQYQKQGLVGEARRLLEEVVQAAPAMAEAYYALGRLNEEEGDSAGAVRQYQLFLSTGAGRFPALEAAVGQRIRQIGG
jgi:tetratricopeptide (TPR) repeat protein